VAGRWVDGVLADRAEAGSGSGRPAQAARPSGARPSSRYASRYALTHVLGPPATPWLPASRSVTSTDPHSRRCNAIAPSYGAAASRSAARISVGGSSPGPVRTSRGRCRGAGQYAHGRFVHTLSHVSKGAVRASRVLSRSQTRKSVGQGPSLHSTAVYTAFAFSCSTAASGYGPASWISGFASPRRYAESASARCGQ
jgi:hypothetical protein